MDKFVTVTKPSRNTSTDSSKDKSSRTKYRYNPYGVSKSNERSFEKWKDDKRRERIIAPLKNAKEASRAIPSSSQLTRHLLNTLSEECNPITHSDSARRADHVVSLATGHQRSEMRPSRSQYFEQRNKKLQEQTVASEMKVLSNVRVYINGYLRDTTDIEMKRIVAEAGGQNLRVAAGATHILTSHQLNGTKTHKLLTTNTKVKVHVVRPEWVTDSIKAGKRLPERTYSVINDSTTRNLTDILGGSTPG
ncbi:hypothetical protein BV25DRAFT_1874048 [Artomyces pyxidatus]|uniref:Uncharacterized protein n=1 Tax=Artomyces pyxidatus TaxID=48021 RepID=A0ACB8TKB1_9AGAM|nr:hypothetical protein BV25DRAFT_1874048 [Artomyces pyxidatus]